MTTATITHPTPAAKADQIEQARQIARNADRQWDAAYNFRPALATEYPLIARCSNHDIDSANRAPNHLRIVAGDDGTLYVATSRTRPQERNDAFTRLLIG